MILLGDSMNLLIFTFFYFILGLIISSLILYYNENIDAYNDRIFLFLTIMFYPIIIPISFFYITLMKFFEYIEEIKNNKK
jgi:hypothetical protein